MTDILGWVLLFSTGLYISLELLWSAILLAANDMKTPNQDAKVSVLIAARNEAPNILRLLRSLDLQDYPQDRMEILIGDDRSTDATAALIREFIRDRPLFRLVTISSDLQGLRGKQNVLAQLAQEAAGDLLLITDADIEVSPGWVSGMVAQFNTGTGMASAVTLAEPKGMFGGLQSVDWAVGMGVNGAMSILGLPITAVGNNMAVLKSIYHELGGYEGLPYSVTEDLLLFREMVMRRGYRFCWSMSSSTINRTLPVPDLRSWLRQRKRWFSGGVDIPWYGSAVLAVYYMHMPVMISSLFFLPWQDIVMAWGARILGDFCLLSAIGFRTGDYRPITWVLPYQPWAVLQTILLPLNQLWPGGVIWKGRKV